MGKNAKRKQMIKTIDANLASSYSPFERKMIETGTHVTTEKFGLDDNCNSVYGKTLVENVKRANQPITRKQFVLCSNPRTHKSNGASLRNNNVNGPCNGVILDGDISETLDEIDRYDIKTGFAKPRIETKNYDNISEKCYGPRVFPKLKPTYIRYHAEHSTTNNRIPSNTVKPAKLVDNTTNA